MCSPPTIPLPPTPSRGPAAGTSLTTAATDMRVQDTGSAPLSSVQPKTQTQAHIPVSGNTSKANTNTSVHTSQPWIHRPISRAPSAENLHFSPNAGAATAASRSPFVASMQPDSIPHLLSSFPPPPSPSPSSSSQTPTPQNRSPSQSPTIGARVPKAGMVHSSTRNPEIRRQQSAYTLGSADTSRNHGYYNHSARGTPILHELPPLRAPIAAGNTRKASTSVSTTSSSSAYAPSMPTSPTGTSTSTNTSYTTHTMSPIPTSPTYGLLSAPTSPTDAKALPPLPPVSRHPPLSHGPRKAVSHTNIRSVRTRSRPATTEGAMGNRGNEMGMSAGLGAGLREREGNAVGEEREWEIEKARERDDLALWESKSAAAHAQANIGAVAQIQRSRASSAVGTTSPVEEVTPWDVYVGDRVGNTEQKRDKARDEIEEEDKEYGISRPMEFSKARTRVSNAASTYSAGSGSTVASSAPSVRSRASSSALALTGPIDEVTPWEVQAPLHSPSVRSRASSNAVGATGPVEEVTPWEVQTLVEESDRASQEIIGNNSTASGSKPTTKNVTPSARKTKDRSDSHSTTAPSMRTTPSVRSRASSAALGQGGYTLGAGAGGSVATGPVEVVTPWEVQVPTTIDDEGVDLPRTSRDGSPAYGVEHTLEVDAAPFVPTPTTPEVTSTATGAVEEVTPWEMQTGPGETAYGVTREVRVPAAERERPRSVRSFHSTGTGGYGTTPNTATSMAHSSSYNNNTTNSHSNSKAPSMRSGRSRASSVLHSPGGVGTTSTGSVEDVTPWEMYPPPPALHPPPPPPPTAPGRPASSSSLRKQEREERVAKTKEGTKSKEGRRWGRKSIVPSEVRVTRSGTGSSTNGATPTGVTTVPPSITPTTSTDGSSVEANYARSVKSTHTHRSAGPVEDVTPWEVQELPSSPPLPHAEKSSGQAIASSGSDTSPIPHFEEFIPIRSPVSRSTSAATTSTNASTLHAPTRPKVPATLAEEITPWELAGALPLQVKDVTGMKGIPLGVTVAVHVPGENEWRLGSTLHAGESQELEVPSGWGDGSTPNTANFSTNSGHHSGSGHGPPPSAGSHVSYISNASTATGSGFPARGSMTLEQLAEVMPWELHPVPTKVGSEMSAEEKRKNKRTHESNAHARQSTSGAGSSGAVAQALADLGLRRRRSTGASGAEAIASGSTDIGGTAPRGSKKVTKLSRMSTSTAGVVGGVSSSDVVLPAEADAYPGPHPASTSPISRPSSKKKGKARADELQDDANDRFSTADRAILEELKAGIRAREAQFKLKGVGHTVLGGGRGPGKKYHPYAKEVVPYPRAYGKDVIDLDVWETLYYMDMTDSVSWHVFENPPTKVLEIGCGTGTWLLHCARTWKDCHFVGLDIVPLHPDLQNVGSPELASRITWVQHNFLEGLPFQNEEFDFVHIKRIALGVPENKWDSVFEEVARVMKPGGRLEIIEEDLFFPGKKADEEDDDHTTFIRDDASLITRRDSTSSQQSRPSNATKKNGDTDRDTLRLDDVSERSEPKSPPAYKSPDTQLLNGMGITRPDSPIRSGNINGNPIPNHGAPDPVKFTGGGRHHLHSDLVFPAHQASGSLSVPTTQDQVILPHSRSTSRPTLPVHKPKETYTDYMLSSSSVSLLGTMGYLAYHDPLAEAMKLQRKQDIAAKKNQELLLPQQQTQQKAQKKKPSPLLTQLMTKGPVNPRDHTILAAIWEGMLDGRFVNPTPLSVLQTYLEYHFTGIRTHPPLIYTFPPIPPKVEESDDEEEPSVKTRVSGLPESDSDDARDAVPRPKTKFKTRSNLSSNSSSSQTGSEEKRFLSMASLVTRESPFVSFDGARSYAYSPSKKALFRARTKDEKSTTEKESSPLSNEPHIMPRMPNTTLHIDLNPLNMQLTLRAKEIVACSESMWEWVEELQNSPAGDEMRNGMTAPWYEDGTDTMLDSDVTRSIILDMTREDFDRLLCNFEWDMLDKACMGQALADRFSWHTFEGAILMDRKAYNKACKDYDDWAEEELKMKHAADDYQRNKHRSHNSSSTPGLVLTHPNVSSLSQDMNQIVRSSSIESSASSLAPSTNTLLDDTSSIATTLAPTRNRAPETASSVSAVLEAASMTSSVPSSQMLPQQMLSRAIRVFVAWKPV